MNNEQVRQLLESYYIKNHRPSLILIAKEIPISYSHLLNFKNSKVELSQHTLNLIIKFIEEDKKQKIEWSNQ